MPTGSGDEATPASQSALELARQTDGDYAADMDKLSPGEAATVEASRIERKLRGHPREVMGPSPDGDGKATEVRIGEPEGGGLERIRTFYRSRPTRLSAR